MTTLTLDPAADVRPQTIHTPAHVRRLHGDEVLDELDRMERELRHDMWTERVGQPIRQRWDCRGCGATFVRRFADGAVSGSAPYIMCAHPRRLERARQQPTVDPPPRRRRSWAWR